jgi:hypothetical protein
VISMVVMIAIEIDRYSLVRIAGNQTLAAPEGDVLAQVAMGVRRDRSVGLVDVLALAHAALDRWSMVGGWPR